MTKAAARTRLGGLFCDHAVLQAERPTPVWGWDVPGGELRLTLSGPSRGSGGDRALTTRADAAGRFRFDLPKAAAGGPYVLIVEGSTRVAVEDVWFGEVWLASGQSNMEWTVASARDAAREIPNATWPGIRMFKVAPRACQEPAEDAEGSWRVCSPESVGELSAVGYFFARELHEAHGAHIGIIDASWGGTCIEAWTSLEALRPVLPELGALQAQLKAELERLPELTTEYGQGLLAWQRENLPSDTHNLGLEQGWALEDDSTWPSMELPGFWQSRGLAFNGIVWFRRTVEIPPSWAGEELSLCLGAIDDFDDTYFDGEPIGRTPPGTLDSHRLPRRYPIPAARVTVGRHAIAVRVFDHFGAGGFAGPAPAMYLECKARPGERMPLEGAWRFRVEREVPLVPLSVFESFPQPPLALAQQNTPAALFNGMIAPLVPYALRGALWYQGESNTERHASYRALQVAMMRDLRTRFGQGQFPFYYVQLASFTASASWPLFREAQTQVASEPESAMVVTLDIGDPNDIHPTNKQEVGRRLALAARALTYGESSLVWSGPRLRRVRIEGSEVRVELTSAEGLRTRDGRPVTGFQLAGSDGHFVKARAQLAGDEVLLTSTEVSAPCAVRYAWADNPDANLENAAGLPAAPFRTDAAASE